MNYYDNLCNPIDYAQAMTPHEALSFLFGQRRDKFDAVVLQRTGTLLGVYPPGSVVTLSNDAMAMVISVNPARPLPSVGGNYDEKVPRRKKPFCSTSNRRRRSPSSTPCALRCCLRRLPPI